MNRMSRMCFLMQTGSGQGIPALSSNLRLKSSFSHHMRIILRGFILRNRSRDLTHCQLISSFFVSNWKKMLNELMKLKVLEKVVEREIRELEEFAGTLFNEINKGSLTWVTFKVLLLSLIITFF